MAGGWAGLLLALAPRAALAGESTPAECADGADNDADGRIDLDDPDFGFDSDAITPSAQATLDAVAATLRAHPEIARVEVAGHADAVGPAAYNQDLSERRAAAVCTWLNARGVEADRLVPAEHGEGQPPVPNDTAAHRAQNRRVEVHVVQQGE